MAEGLQAERRREGGNGGVIFLLGLAVVKLHEVGAWGIVAKSVVALTGIVAKSVVALTGTMLAAGGTMLAAGTLIAVTIGGAYQVQTSVQRMLGRRR